MNIHIEDYDIETNDDFIAAKYVMLKHSAKKRGHDFDLNLTDIRALMQKTRCHYTDKRLTIGNRSIDRVDASKGYIKGNVVMCIQGFNTKKADLTKEEIIQMYHGVMKDA